MKVETLRQHGTGRAALTVARSGTGVRHGAVIVELSIPMIVWARRILRHGTPELVAAVEDGHLALYMAAKVATWAHEDQRRFLDLARTRTLDRTITARCLAIPAPSPTQERDA